MANNEYVNRVDYGNNTLIDISDTTAEAGDVIEGKKVYLKSGAPATGTLGDATTSSHGLMSAADKTKLDGIEEGAQADTVILTYGVSTWNDFITAYNANKAIFCKVQISGATQTRLVPLCYVDTGTASSRKAEFQYYRSRNDGTNSITYNDELYLYILRYTNSVWETSVRLVTTEPVSIPNATTTTAGLMSSTDKEKLDELTSITSSQKTIIDTSIAAFTDATEGKIIEDLVINLDLIQNLNGQSTPIPPRSTPNIIPNFTNTENGYIKNRQLDYEGNDTFANYWYISEYFPIEANTVYTLQQKDEYAVTPAVCFYDSNKEFISGEAFNERSYFTITTPNTAAYCRCTQYINTNHMVQMVVGDTPAENIEVYSNICPIEEITSVTIYNKTNFCNEDFTVGESNYLWTSNSSIRPGLSYYIHNGQNTQIQYREIGADLSTIQTQGRTTNGVTRNITYNIRIGLKPDVYGPIYKHDISVNYPSTDTNYYPYRGQEKTIDLTTYAKGQFASGRLNVNTGELIVSKRRERINANNLQDCNNIQNGRVLVYCALNTNGVSETTDYQTSHFSSNTAAQDTDTIGSYYYDKKIYMRCPAAWGSTFQEVKTYINNNETISIAYPVTEGNLIYHYEPTYLTTYSDKNMVFSNSGNIYSLTYTIGNSTTELATNKVSGLMTSEDKEKLDLLSPSSYLEDQVLYTSRIPTLGNRKKDILVGGSIWFNQLIPDTPFEMTYNGVTCTRETGGEIYISLSGIIDNTLSPKWEFTFSDLSINVIAGHKYYIDKFQGPDCSLSINSVKMTNNTMILNAEEDGTFIFSSSSNYTTRILINACDLTLMLGQQTADQLYALPNNQGAKIIKKIFFDEVLAYNSGELINIKPQTYETIGFNLFDEEWEIGKKYTSNGPETATGWIYSKHKIKVTPNTTYYFSLIGLSQSIRPYVLRFDKYNNYLSSSNATVTDNYSFSTNERTYYIIITFAYINQGNEKYCLNIYDETRNGTYEPYHKISYSFDNTKELYGIPKLDWQNNLYFDGDIYENDGTITRKFGKVDLSSLRWISSGSGYRMPYNDISNVKPHGIILGEGLSEEQLYIDNQGKIAISPKETYESVEAFKAAMSEHYVIYELNTPTTENAARFEPIHQVLESYEAYIGTHTIFLPMGHISQYYNLDMGYLNYLPELKSDNKNYLIHQNKGKMELSEIEEATSSAAGLMSTSDKLKLNGIETGAQVNPTVMVGATSVAAGSSGLVPAPALGDANKYLKGDGTWGVISGSGSSGGASEIAIFNYGSATWTEFLEAYNAEKIIFCQANGTSSQETRIAPIIYHNLNKVEFQYYRSADITGASLIKYDEVYIYTLYSDNTWETIVRPIRNQVMTGATSSTNGTSGTVPVPTSADIDKFLAGDGTYKSGGLPMVILSYGNSTWNDFINAYNNNVIVYCRASSSANPASGSQTRMAFMAYVNNASSPTEVEFQYYRSVSSHTSSQMGDQVFVYKLNSSGTWSVTTREASLKQIKIGTGDAASVSYSSNVITLKGGLPAVTASDNGKILQVVNGVWTAVTPS